MTENRDYFAPIVFLFRDVIIYTNTTKDQKWILGIFYSIQSICVFYGEKKWVSP